MRVASAPFFGRGEGFNAKAQGKLESYFASQRFGDLALEFIAGWA